MKFLEFLIGQFPGGFRDRPTSKPVPRDPLGPHGGEKPQRPLPKIFRLSGKVVDDVCAGNVINTVSMMCVEDYNKCLEWVDSVGGLEARGIPKAS